MEKLLEKDLQSLIVSKNLFSLIEIIVVNDGSKDNTLKIARTFEEKYPDSFMVVDKQNGNYGSCVNAGLAVASGTFVKILDADDFFITYNFEKAIHYLVASEEKKENIDLFFFDWRYVDENGNVIREMTFDIPQNTIIDIKDSSVIPFFKNIQHHAIAYRTKFLIDHNYKQTEGISYSDTEWICIPLLYVKRIKYHPVTVYSYLYGREDQSMSPAQRSKGFNSMLTVEKSLLKTYLAVKGTVDPINEEIYRTKFISSIGYLYSTYMILYTTKETAIGLKEFDDTLKNNCEDIYDSVSDLFTTKPKIRYVKVFRKNPNGFRFRSLLTFYKFRRFIKKIIGIK